MNIKRIICSKSDLKSNLVERLVEDFAINKQIAETYIYKKLLEHLDQIIDDITIFIESPYTDKVYRDSYYTYFSSKLGEYKKDCIRLSLFKGNIDPDLFQTTDSVNILRSQYLGFIVLRPTYPNIVGRSVLSPTSVKKNHFLCVTAPLAATVNFIKFTIEGFPHSSQDTETITCAETTLWAVMEYFGYKYAEYKPVLPSKIIDALKKVSAERQIPSKGLNIQQMAYALKEFGFGTKVYARAEFGPEEFKRLFSTYIESGIPLIVALENSMHGGNIGHAMLAVGHERTVDYFIDNLSETTENNPYIKDKINSIGIKLFDNDDIDKNFVFIDDNMPPYQLGKLDAPTIHYPNTEWHNCEITYFIAPLYPKIYLEAFEAKSFFKRLLLDIFPISSGSEIFIRFFLTSSRSYKHELMLNTTFDSVHKDLILETPMPKFIWVGEVSNKQLIKNRQADGLFIFDATEANTQSVKALIYASYKGIYITFDSVSKWIKRNVLPLRPFSIFTNNLKGY